ncbi:MAG: chemotaxis protein CheA [Myxococcales bacterium]|nr:chemotaxis protein CheA [Myxococcales bacterium]
MTVGENEELINEFLVEAREIVMDVEVTLMNLERVRLQEGVVSKEQLNAAFRGFHTIKGVSGFFSFERMVKAAHEAENLLDLLRSDKLVLVEDHVTVLCESLDLLTNAIDNLEGSGQPGLSEEQVSALATRIRALATNPEAPESAEDSEAPAPPGEGEPSDAPAAEPPPPTEAPKAAVEAAAAPATPAPAAAPAAPAAPVAAPPTPPAAAAAPPPKTPAGGGGSGGGKGGGKKSESSSDKANRSIRVDLRKLDQLMNLVGELIIAENVITHEQDASTSEPSQRATQQLDRVTRSLQHLAMSMRMVPIRTLFRKMVRVVRDVARRQGKEVRVTLEGEDTEVDKTVVESISDPLMHLVRNAVDHGIESPDERVKLGKDPVGEIVLSARHESGEVRVTIADNGKGLNTERIREKAVSKGLVPNDAVLDHAQICDLIFQPGFSTAQTVTNISGRGVGMDVVRRNVESVRGRVDVDSESGAGSAFTLRLPLTLAIIEGMMMRLGNQVFTVPLLAIRESVSVNEYERLRLPSGTELVDLRGQMVPLLPMQDLVPYVESTEEEEEARPILVVIEDDGKRAGIVADELIGQRQVVIKPIPSFLAHVNGLTGCSILGNGEISLILDVKHLLSTVQVASDERPAQGGQAASTPTLEARP